MKWSSVSVASLLVAAACAGPGSVSPGGGLMYRVPPMPLSAQGKSVIMLQGG